MKKRIIFYMIFTMFISNNVKGQNIEENLGSWWMYFGTHKFSEKYSLHYETQLRNYEIVSNFYQLLPRVGLNYHIDKNTSITAGYAWIPTQTSMGEGFDGDLVTENRIWQQFILKNKVGNINFRHRYRLEQRWIKLGEETKYKNRARYMLSLRLPISKNDDSPLFISLYDEIFLNISDTPFDQNRLFAALGYQINKQMNFQLGYLRHRSGGLDLNRLQLAVFLNTGN
ncbi:MAG: DUF2490 domain-containing protein [Flavobacteriales bacterium]